MEINKEQVVEYLSNLPVMEVAVLVKELEEKWGVSATPAPAPPKALVEEKVEEQTEFTVVLTSYGEKKIIVIKALREVIPGLGLREAKALAEEVPSTLKEGISAEEAEALKTKLTEAGGKVEIK